MRSDWPHDLTAYMASDADPSSHAGAIPQPFPDVTMALSMVWYLSDVDADSAGTWVVPYSHLDARNPRGPADNVNVQAPIAGELQVSAPAGSVFIQDTRTWFDFSALCCLLVPSLLMRWAACAGVGTARRCTTPPAASAWPWSHAGLPGG